MNRSKRSLAQGRPAGVTIAVNQARLGSVVATSTASQPQPAMASLAICRAAGATPAVAASHKIALIDIKAGGVVLRYGEPIVQARDDIGKGRWVHVHNTQPIERD